MNIINKRISREYLSNPYIDINYKQRLIKSNAIDLRNNSKIEYFNNGYCSINPIDKNKFYN